MHVYLQNKCYYECFRAFTLFTSLGILTVIPAFTAWTRVVICFAFFFPTNAGCPGAFSISASSFPCSSCSDNVRVFNFIKNSVTVFVHLKFDLNWMISYLMFLLVLRVWGTGVWPQERFGCFNSCRIVMLFLFGLRPSFSFWFNKKCYNSLQHSYWCFYVSITGYQIHPFFLISSFLDSWSKHH